MYRKALSLQEMEDIINDPRFMEADDVDIIVVPPDPDSLTDEDEADDDILGPAEVNDVPGELIIHFKSSTNLKSNEIDEPDDVSAPGVSSGQEKNTSAKKTKKKRYLTDDTCSWKKTTPVYTKLPPEGSSAATNAETLSVSLAEKSPLECFEELFTNDIMEYIVKETVRYAGTKNNAGFTLSPDELKVFIGILLFSGYHQVPSERHYWCEDEDLGVNVIKKCMSRNRYIQIKRYLHFADNAQVDMEDKGFKVRPLIKMINAEFKKYDIFEKTLAVDEMIVKYYGHSGLKQFIRGKPIRFGYKFWALCGTSGYCYNFDLYTGKAIANNEREDLTLGSRVVLDMLDCVSNPASYWIYFDNLFTSRDLLIYLRKLGYRATGTLRENRLQKCPIKDSKSLGKEDRGTFDFRFDTNGEILVVKWNDNKCVTAATNFDYIEPLFQASRWDRKARAKRAIPQPQLLKNYNSWMGGVDQHDWFVGKYATKIRAKKWYWPLFTRILDMAVVNAWIVYRQVNKTNITLLEYRRSICVPYIKLGESVRPTMGKPRTSKSKVFCDVRFDGKGHFMKKRDKQRRCQGDNCKSKPLTYCVKCDITLCQNCFVQYHVK